MSYQGNHKNDYRADHSYDYKNDQKDNHRNDRRDNHRDNHRNDCRSNYRDNHRNDHRNDHRDNSSDDHKYDDIINLQHPTSSKHPRMSLKSRAAQFAPFAALTGHDAAINETVRLTDEKQTLSDEAITILNQKLQLIAENIDAEQSVDITHFVPDKRKAGGAYVTHSGIVKKIDIYKRVMVMMDGTIIPISQISEIDGDLFDNL